MTDNLTTKKTDYGYQFDFTVTDSDGNARNLTGYTVTIKIWKQGKPNEIIATGTCTQDVPASGTCHYTVVEDDFRQAVKYQYELEMTKTGVIESSESGVLTIEDSP